MISPFKIIKVHSEKHHAIKFDIYLITGVYPNKIGLEIRGYNFGTTAYFKLNTKLNRYISESSSIQWSLHDYLPILIENNIIDKMTVFVDTIKKNVELYSLSNNVLLHLL
jgi:hypothetical protein